MTRGRRWVLVTVLSLIGVPVVLALQQGIAFHVANRSTHTLASDGEKREYVLYVPTTWDSTGPTPLVISMHGAGLWGAAQRETSQWNRVADAAGFIVAYPSAVRGSGPAIWRVQRGPGLMRDVRFVSALIDTLRAEYNIDPTRVYANGLSNGGGMAFVLSCTLSDRIAAIGMVASAQTLPFRWCEDDRPVPVIAFHGTRDPIVPYEGGTTWISSRPFPNVARFVTDWARRNRCGTVPLESAVAADVTRLEYASCADGAAVVLYRIEGGGHTWPGGKPPPESWTGLTSRSIDASSQMWAFFREHRTSTAARGETSR